MENIKLIATEIYKGHGIYVYAENYRLNGRERTRFFTRLDDKPNATVYYFTSSQKAIEARKEEM